MTILQKGGFLDDQLPYKAIREPRPSWLHTESGTWWKKNPSTPLLLLFFGFTFFSSSLLLKHLSFSLHAHVLMDFLQAVSENKLVNVRGILQAGLDVNSLIAWNAKRTFTPLISSRIAKQPELVKKIQNSEDYYAHPLNLAVIGGHEDMVRLLLSAGADINLKDGRGRFVNCCAWMYDYFHPLTRCMCCFSELLSCALSMVWT